MPSKYILSLSLGFLIAWASACVLRVRSRKAINSFFNAPTSFAALAALKWVFINFMSGLAFTAANTGGTATADKSRVQAMADNILFMIIPIKLNRWGRYG